MFIQLSSNKEVLTICNEHNIFSRLPESVQMHLSHYVGDGSEPEKKREEKEKISRVHTALIGSAKTSASAVEAFLQSLGFTTHIWTNSMEGKQPITLVTYCLR